MSRGRHSLADDNGPRSGPFVKHQRIRRLSAVVGGAQFTNDLEWPSEQKRSPHLVDFPGNRAKGEMGHVDGQAEPAPAQSTPNSFQ